MTRTQVDMYRGFTVYACEDGTFLAEFGPVRLQASSLPLIRKAILNWWEVA